jgi:osmotically-inducible protein OsmY
MGSIERERVATMRIMGNKRGGVGAGAARCGRLALIAVCVLAVQAAPARADAASDERTRARVVNRLEGQVSLSIEHMGIIVANGVVRISGTVGSLGEIKIVDRIVGGMTDVRLLINELTVRQSGRSQADIEQEVRDALTRRMRFRASPIEIGVSGGIVTLRGKVPRAIDEVDAEAIAADVPGVTGVVNEITIQSEGSVSPVEVQKRVESILRNPLTFGVVRELLVGVQNGIVTLNGWTERDQDRLEAERLALTVPGVLGVNNQIVVLGP